MSRRRSVGTLLILLGSLVSILWGVSLERNRARSMTDFRAVYFGSRCLLQNRDPYDPHEFLAVFFSEGGEFASDSGASQLQRRSIPVCINLPTSLFLTAGLAWLSWGPAHWIWFILTSISFLIAGVLAWDLAAERAPRVALILICTVVANCEVLLSSGDLAGFAVCLCVIAVWCFLRNRLVVPGVLCLATSLVIKPHDAGLVWLFFLLGGALYRRRALQTLAVTIAISIPAVIWAARAAPGWVHELQTNLAATSAHGSIRDPGPDSASANELQKVIDLQSVISVFWDDPRIYNPLTYLGCGALLIIWAVRTVRSRISASRDWIALAAIVPLTMLITYHRPYDAKLLLLTIPGCAMVWAKGGPIAYCAVLIESAAVVLTADIPSAILAILTSHVHVGTVGTLDRLMTLFLFRTAVLALLATAVFYLYVYVQLTSGKLRLEQSSAPG